MNEPSISTSTRLNRALDWAGPIPAAFLLAFGIDEYRDGGSVGWPVGGALMLLLSFWVIYRGRPRRTDKDTKSP